MIRGWGYEVAWVGSIEALLEHSCEYGIAISVSVTANKFQKFLHPQSEQPAYQKS
jgi:hypothetical protein